MTIGTTASEANTLLYVAEAKGYFVDSGLDVTIKTYTSGKAAVDGMLKGDVDVATATEFAFVGNVFNGDAVRAIGVINRSVGEYLLARPDQGINSLADLVGKRIGVPMKSRPEFALGRFLFLNGIDTARVTLVDVPVDKSVDALAKGDVDAVASWQPYIDQAQAALGGKAPVWPVQNGQPSYNGLVCTAGWTAQHPDLINKLLKAVVQAEGYNLGHPDQVKAIVEARLGRDAAYIDSVWPDYQFSVFLDQSLIVAMEDEARWEISSGLAAGKQVPNFTSYIYTEALAKVKPGSVTVIR